VRIRPLDLAYVAAGGALGTLARDGVEHAFALAPGRGWPVATLLVNLVGAFLLGLLLGVEPAARWRLALGTGVLGGFTTYSTLAIETVLLARAGHWGDAVGYPLISVVVGLGLAVAGLRIADRLRRS
jgi:CrcB protein